MFKQTNTGFLALSIALSVKTIYFVTLKCISILKPFLGFTTKLVLMAWIVASASARVFAIVVYFAPSFGLFSILGHWEMEKIPYAKDLHKRIEANNNTVYLYNTKPFSWTDLNRYNYSTATAPHYNLYTCFSLQEFFLGFWILFFLHICLNALAKALCSEDFRNNGDSSLLFKFIHCVENTNFPTIWMDWEEKTGSIEDHKRRHGQVITEMIVVMIIRTIINGVMMVPLIYTGIKKIPNIFQETTLNSSNQSLGAS